MVKMHNFSDEHRTQQFFNYLFIVYSFLFKITKILNTIRNTITDHMKRSRKKKI